MGGAHEITWWGGFDPNTLGVWISLDKVFDLPDIENAKMLFIRTLVEPPGDDHREYIRSLSSDEERYSAYTAFTIFYHEWQHWYDAISTPFGLYRTGQLAAFYATIASAYDELAELPLVYSPLIRWLRSPTIVKAIHPSLGELPPITAKVLDHALIVLKKAEKDLLATATIQGKTISTIQILESLAMLRQEQAIEDAFGFDAAKLVRNSIKTNKGGECYYAPIDLIQNKSIEDRSTQARVLESTLFANYGAFGSQCPISPPMILNMILDKLSEKTRKGDLINILYNYKVLSFTRREAFEMTYAAAKITMVQMQHIPTLPNQSSHAARVRSALGAGLLSAFLTGGVARFGRELVEPYKLYPLLLVEGYPGIITPDSLDFPISTFAGASFKSVLDVSTFIQESKLGQFKPIDKHALPGPYTLHAVWTPRWEHPEEMPPYFEIFNIFYDLMYWRSLIFGINRMSPFTVFFITQRIAQDIGQSIVT